MEQITTDFDRDRWFTPPEAVAYVLADEVIGGPAGTLESGTPASRAATNTLLPLTAPPRSPVRITDQIVRSPTAPARR